MNSQPIDKHFILTASADSLLQWWIAPDATCVSAVSLVLSLMWSKKRRRQEHQKKNLFWSYQILNQNNQVGQIRSEPASMSMFLLSMITLWLPMGLAWPVSPYLSYQYTIFTNFFSKNLPSRLLTRAHWMAPIGPLLVSDLRQTGSSASVGSQTHSSLVYASFLSRCTAATGNPLCKHKSRVLH